ncbi:MAG: biotin transporter BioY [Firmicutes bacterium]|nr:biotin transporter BioY [Bacillota bacterium]
MIVAQTNSTGKTRQLVLAALMAAVTSVLAYVRIPIPGSPVPITGQTFGLMLAALLLGPRFGALSQAVYLLMGIAGLPVFAGGQAGLAVLAGPTGGYLWGHVIGAFVGGLWVRPGARPTFLRALAGAVTGGIAAVYVPGVLQLAWVTGMDWPAAIAAGALPFLPGDFLKAAAAAAVAVRVAAAALNLGLPAQESARRA